MNKAIIHISDLHVSLHETLKKAPIDCNSFLTTNTVDGEIDNFISEFTNKIKKQFKDYDLYLIISGDIADKAIIEEFISAEKIINKIITELKIDKNNILIVPGDHDINRDDCETAHQKGIRESDTRKSYEYFDEKFQNFKSFYEGFYEGKKTFVTNKSVIDHIVFNSEKLVIVGLNSNYKIDYDGGNGFFHIENLKEDLKNLMIDFPDFSVMAVFHHNIFASYDNKMVGQWDNCDSNRLAVFKVFEGLGINTLLYGNEHTRCSFYNSNHKLTYSDSGVFANSKQSPTPSFKVYEVIHDNNKLILKNNLFLLIKAGLTDLEFPCGKWTLQIQAELDGEIEEIAIRLPVESVVKEDLSLDIKSEEKIIASISEKSINPESKGGPANYIPFDTKDEDHKSLLKLIKKKDLFHSGHFHWSETSRAHNWIDMSKLLNNKEDLLNTKKYIITLIDKNKLDFDFIIGLGIEGNMLATRASVIKNKDYSFLPYSYRYDDHSDYEKQLNFENNGKYKSVLIITDVVHDGRTIRKLIHKKRKEDKTADFFKTVDKVIVISLFYTGHLPLDTSDHFDLLNKREEDEYFDHENDHLEDRIQFHFVSHIKVDECPYNKDNYKTDCIIVREGLGCVHKFYTEKH
jgi:orotate phosphoribosyltransferase/3',5'-cyclic AMP phosphodiesterase CpdA